MKQSKVYLSEKWLRLQYLRLRKSPQEIAEMCGVSQQTIYTQINKFKLRR